MPRLAALPISEFLHRPHAQRVGMRGTAVLRVGDGDGGNGSGITDAMGLIRLTPASRSKSRSLLAMVAERIKKRGRKIICRCNILAWYDFYKCLDGVEAKHALTPLHFDRPPQRTSRSPCQPHAVSCTHRHSRHLHLHASVWRSEARSKASKASKDATT